MPNWWLFWLLYPRREVLEFSWRYCSYAKAVLIKTISFGVAWLPGGFLVYWGDWLYLGFGMNMKRSSWRIAIEQGFSIEKGVSWVLWVSWLLPGCYFWGLGFVFTAFALKNWLLYRPWEPWWPVRGVPGYLSILHSSTLKNRCLIASLSFRQDS